jgi:uncharacterized protein (DUF433 family)
MLTKQRPSPAEISAAMALVVEDPDVQGGAATFRGTRILVQQIAQSLAQGADEAELFQDYPRLTREMVEAARLYGKLYPDRGHARKPNWSRT